MKDGRLEVSDLMNGDLVMVNDVEHTHPLQITEIYMKCGTPYVTLEWNGMPNEDVHDTLTADVDKVLPIPLTAEILEKNEWSQDIYSNESYDNEDIERLSLWVGEDGKNAWWWHVGCELVIPINYVHELQHALILCGSDKKIEL